MPESLRGLRVLLLATTLNPGGVSSSLRTLVRALLDLDASVSVCALETAEGPLADWLRASSVAVRALGVPKWTYSLRTTAAVAHLFDEVKPSVVNAHCYEPAFHACRARLKAPVPWLLITHHDPRMRLHRVVANRLCRHIPDRVVMVSEGLRRLYRRWCAYPDDKVVVLPNAVDVDRFRPAPKDPHILDQLGLAGAFPVIGNVGGFGRPKGQPVLVRAFSQLLRRLPRARLVFVGDGRHRPHTEALARRLGVADRVVFAGYRSDIPQLLTVFDIYVQPSWREADPVAVKEAMAAGKPVVSTATLGPASFIEHGRTGLLVPIGDPRALADAIATVATDPALARRLSDAARRYAVAELSLQRYRQRVADLFGLAVRHPSGPPA